MVGADLHPHGAEVGLEHRQLVAQGEIGAWARSGLVRKPVALAVLAHDLTGPVAEERGDVGLLPVALAQIPHHVHLVLCGLGGDSPGGRPGDRLGRLIDAALGQAGEVGAGQPGFVQGLERVLQRAVALVPDERDGHDADLLGVASEGLVRDGLGGARRPFQQHVVDDHFGLRSPRAADGDDHAGDETPFGGPLAPLTPFLQLTVGVGQLDFLPRVRRPDARPVIDESVGRDGDLDRHRHVSLHAEGDRLELGHQRHGLGKLVLPIGEIVSHVVGEFEPKAGGGTAVESDLGQGGVGGDRCRLVAPSVRKRLFARLALERLAHDVLGRGHGRPQQQDAEDPKPAHRSSLLCRPVRPGPSVAQLARRCTGCPARSARLF
jgi:hypothetical protein